jgi:multidrug efflux system outer membrane protein
MPAKYRFTISEDSVPPLKWSELYADTTLQGLIKVVLKENLDLQKAIGRVAEAAAQAGMNKADIYPSFGYAGIAGAISPSQNNINEIGGGANRDIFSLRGTVNWELDFWGKYRHANRAAIAELLGTQMNRQALVSSLIAETASLYFHLRSLDQQLAVAQLTLTTRKESTRLITLKFQGGEVPELDKFQAQTQEAIAAGMIPDIERQILQTENSLSILMGRSSRSIQRGVDNSAQQFPAVIPEGLPSQLLRRRPDVLSAEQRWVAQNERIGVAQAMRYPSINLTGWLGVASQDLGAITSSSAGTWGVLGSVSGPIFNFGKNKRRAEVEKAKTLQVAADYDKAVITALSEVDYSLFAITSYRTEYLARQQEVAAATNAVRLSRLRYNDGFTSYSEVLDNERTLLNSQMSAARTLEAQLQATVYLYKALGGGSDTTLQ